jgi:hypothetical protein
VAAERVTVSLLPRGSLAGVRLGVSVSDSPDLGRLGFSEIHLRLALGEIARVVLLGGGRLVYGGRLDPSGYTAFLQGELEKYARRDQPLIVCLAWQEHRERTLAELDEAEADLGLYGRIVYLNRDGKPTAAGDGRDSAPAPVNEASTRVESLTALRRYIVSETDARVLVGGRRTGFEGAMPGVIEEALIAIEAGQPLFLAAGFGGAAWDAARVLGLTVPDWPDLSDPAADEGVAALHQVASLAQWRPTANGLSEQENLRLASSHRASEVASLVAVGLGRLRSSGELEVDD